jgi:hypothetical protein
MTPTRTTHDKAQHSNTLHNTAKYGKIPVYLKHGNGGYDVNVRLPNSRGGSESTEGVTGYHFTGYQEKRPCGLQDWREVANRPCRLAEMDRHSQKQTRSGKLNYFAFSAATHSELITIGTRLSTERSQLPLHAHSLILRRACLASPVRIDEIWQEVAAREVL